MVDAVTSASVIAIACDTAVQWDCKLLAIFEKIERERFFSTYFMPALFLTYIAVGFFLPLWLLNRKQK